MALLKLSKNICAGSAVKHLDLQISAKKYGVEQIIKNSQGLYGKNRNKRN
jgi:hypothetical protein